MKSCASHHHPCVNDESHVISRTRPSRFSVCNIENLGMGLGMRLGILDVCTCTYPAKILHTVHETCNPCVHFLEG